MTLDAAGIGRVVARLRVSLVLPVHWLSCASLRVFLARVPSDFTIARPGASKITVSLRSLPNWPTILVPEPLPLPDPD